MRITIACGWRGKTPARDEIVVTAARRQLLGTAETASEGVVEDQDIQLTPAYRLGQLLEMVPRLIVTLRSGEATPTNI